MDVLTTALRAATAMAGVGLLCGVLYAVVGFFIDDTRGTLGWGTVLACMAPIGMPVMFGTVGFALGATLAVVCPG